MKVFTYGMLIYFKLEKIRLVILISALCLLSNFKVIADDVGVPVYRVDSSQAVRIIPNQFLESFDDIKESKRVALFFLGNQEKVNLDTKLLSDLVDFLEGVEETTGPFRPETVDLFMYTDESKSQGIMLFLAERGMMWVCKARVINGAMFWINSPRIVPERIKQTEQLQTLVKKELRTEK